ncbi:uncharacterized protein MELLADRAFT_102701 [Melampsora larici-populina 98AG31]|uniref:Uncharacterized protein n=1 Tax=Melampsora larici-populina (strain 98AG31 / pathotype 3-4-7) TaxID=747676 RepID=F4R941_MELLP|nr:uncharacterized protein MELLADRAFT_102701 [Melampsora larici-populina 98AG31]EGG11220.1 hypothetical protein MELLADRAFT_102701 [Melampsora larici-populina 98AG31]
MTQILLVQIDILRKIQVMYVFSSLSIISLDQAYLHGEGTGENHQIFVQLTIQSKSKLNKESGCTGIKNCQNNKGVQRNVYASGDGSVMWILSVDAGYFWTHGVGEE